MYKILELNYKNDRSINILYINILRHQYFLLSQD